MRGVKCGNGFVIRVLDSRATVTRIIPFNETDQRLSFELVLHRAGQQSAAAIALGNDLLKSACIIVGYPKVLLVGVRAHKPNENKMSDGGRERVSLGVKVWKSSQM